MNYEETMSFIHSLDWRGSRPGLSRITELMAKLGNPEKNIKAVHVAGTNGKGSFCSMLDSVLRHAGYKTGLFTSPYIEFFEERIQYCGNPISRDELGDTVSAVKEAADTMSDAPTEFEILTAVGFLYFSKNNVDIAIIECGMGGRLDSTNIIQFPLLSVITGISLDHTAILGDTVAKIAFEKAGIIKENCPVLYGGKDGEAEDVIKSTASEKGCPYVKKAFSELRDIKVNKKGSTFSYKEYKKIKLSLLGTYQPENAANVIEAAEALRKQGLKISDLDIKAGLYEAKWKGRFERLRDNPEIYFDGGHNEEGVFAAVKTVKACCKNKKINVISGVLADKDYKKIAREISTVAKNVYTVTPDNPRALRCDSYAEEFKKNGINAVPCESYEDAVAKGYEASVKGNRPLICVGSLYSYPSFKNAVTAFENNGSRARKLKERAVMKKLGAAFALVLAVLLCFTALIESGIFDKKIKYRDYPPLDDLCEPDFEYNIFEDEYYMSLNKGLTYTSDGIQEYLESESDYASKGEAALFFKKYFEAVINGRTDDYNSFLSDNYIKKNGKKKPFTMQMLYDMEVIFLRGYYKNENTTSEIKVYEFDVGYRILRNNGTYRNNIYSESRRDMLYVLYRYPNGQIKIESMSEYYEIIE